MIPKFGFKYQLTKDITINNGLWQKYTRCPLIKSIQGSPAGLPQSRLGKNTDLIIPNNSIFQFRLIHRNVGQGKIGIQFWKKDNLTTGFWSFVRITVDEWNLKFEGSIKEI